MYRTQADRNGGGVHAAAINLAAQYWEFLSENFKQYLIISSPSLKHVSGLKEVISDILSNTW
jgi:hypothetical protein